MSTTEINPEVNPETPEDPHEVRRALRGTGLLAAFNVAGVLDAADVHVARRLGALAGESDEAVLLGCALAVRAPRLGHVCADLATLRSTVAVEADPGLDVQALPWPDAAAWPATMATSALVADDGTASDAATDAAATTGDVGRPLRLAGTRLYLDRYRRQEQQVAADLLARAAEPADDDDEALADSLDRLFPPGGAGDDGPRRAGLAAATRRLAVIAGGPGTGKTTAVARILALLVEQAVRAGAAPPRIALAAPTGKAAARLSEAVHAEAATLDIDEATRDRLLALEASTLHRLLGWRPGSRSRFRHDRSDRLPHDIVVVDESSMVSLSLMASLVAAVRLGSRLILVGDPEQLASVEAGAVLGDVVGRAGPGPSPLRDAIVVLRHVHRYRGGIAELATAIQAGDADAAMAVLRTGGEDGDVTHVDLDVEALGGSGADALAAVRAPAVAAGRRVLDAARRGDGATALGALGSMRVLCAHRRGPAGAETWMGHVERWLAAAVPGYGVDGAWYVGRPLLVTANDHGLRLYNGDAGVVVAAGQGRVRAVFERSGGLLELAPSRLASVATVHAMTVHKSQGSQFTQVAVVLPGAASPLLTRELLYTAVTRAQERLVIVGPEASIRAAITRPIARASGLRDALWGTHA
jgi:exodeoxyribonuclease V alpha subunit